MSAQKLNTNFLISIFQFNFLLFSFTIKMGENNNKSIPTLNVSLDFQIEPHQANQHVGDKEDLSRPHFPISNEFVKDKCKGFGKLKKVVQHHDTEFSVYFQKNQDAERCLKSLDGTVLEIEGVPFKVFASFTKVLAIINHNYY